MEPFFFGGPVTGLFGAYHKAEGRSTHAVVLCYPLGHEYVRAHRAYRNLAVALCRAGLSVLRFDYAGSGDSSGETDQAGPSQWIDDVDAAVEEIKRRSGLERVSLVGLRFGAAVAALAAARRDDIDTMLLWDPVLHGESYLAELAAVQAAWLRDRLGVSADDVSGDSSDLIGMPASAAMLDEIRAIDLRLLPALRVRNCHIVTSCARADCQQWQQNLVARGASAAYHHIPSAGDWLNPSSVHQLLLPHEILKVIVHILTRC